METNDDFTKISSISELKECLAEDKGEFFVLLGSFRSSKFINYLEDEDMYFVLHEIDETEEYYTEDELMECLGEHMKHGRFYSYGF